jgi:hypothetical protein
MRSEITPRRRLRVGFLAAVSLGAATVSVLAAAPAQAHVTQPVRVVVHSDRGDTPMVPVVHPMQRCPDPPVCSVGG